MEIRNNVTIRLDYELKEKLKTIAHSFNLELPELIEIICFNFVINPTPYSITTEISKIKEYIDELQIKGFQKAELTITNEVNENNHLIKKQLKITGQSNDNTYEQEPITESN